MEKTTYHPASPPTNQKPIYPNSNRSLPFHRLHRLDVHTQYPPFPSKNSQDPTSRRWLNERQACVDAAPTRIGLFRGASPRRKNWGGRHPAKISFLSTDSRRVDPLSLTRVSPPLGISYCPFRGARRCLFPTKRGRSRGSSLCTRTRARVPRECGMRESSRTGESRVLLLRRGLYRADRRSTLLFDDEGRGTRDSILPTLPLLIR